MPKFLFVYRSTSYTAKEISPEEMQKAMQLWTDWIGEGFQKGWMLDAGDALLPDGKLVDKNKVVTDGPFAESKEIVGGYSVVQADNYAAAAEYAKRCPALLDDRGSVEIRQLAGLAPG